MPGHDIHDVIVVGFSAQGVEAVARLPNIFRCWGELPAFHPVPEQPIGPAAAEPTCTQLADPNGGDPQGVILLMEETDGKM